MQFRVGSRMHQSVERPCGQGSRLGVKVKKRLGTVVAVRRCPLHFRSPPGHQTGCSIHVVLHLQEKIRPRQIGPCMVACIVGWCEKIFSAMKRQAFVSLCFLGCTPPSDKKYPNRYHNKQKKRPASWSVSSFCRLNCIAASRAIPSPGMHAERLQV